MHRLIGGQRRTTHCKEQRLMAVFGIDLVFQPNVRRHRKQVRKNVMRYEQRIGQIVLNGKVCDILETRYLGTCQCGGHAMILPHQWL
ncbi:MAG: hypothetical protein ACKV2Q_02175 [Planctomycetaceae bacterium]